MADWIGRLEPGLDMSVLNELDLAMGHARSIPVPFDQATHNPDYKTKLISMGYPLKNARDLVIETLIRHTDLPLGMNALDGD